MVVRYLARRMSRGRSGVRLFRGPEMVTWSDVCIQGLDLSLSATGMVTVHDGHRWVETIETPATWSSHRRRRHIAVRVRAMLKDKLPALVIVEQPIPSIRSVKVAVELAALYGVVREYIWMPGVAVAEVWPTRLKSYAGKGSFSKVEMLTQARKELTPHFGFATDHNQADAMWLACMGEHHIGRCPVDITKNRASAVKLTEWPDVELAATSTRE